MTQASNAGIKRNRRPAGTKAQLRKLFLDPSTDREITDACSASGNVSRSLYIEQLIALVKAEHGTLPVFSPQLDNPEEATSAAA